MGLDEKWWLKTLYCANLLNGEILEIMVLIVTRNLSTGARGKYATTINQVFFYVSALIKHDQRNIVLVRIKKNTDR